MAELEEVVSRQENLPRLNSRVRGARLFRHPRTGSTEYDRRYAGAIFPETWEPFDIPPSADDSFHVVVSGEEGRLDLISWRYYEDSNYDWVLAMVNGLPDMVRSVRLELILRIPAVPSIHAAFRNRRAGLI